ncbi:hypothetical protein Efla_006104 [Eimeria flavescens]
MDNVEVQPHIQLRQGQVQPVVMTMGDPQRVDLVLEQCESHEDLAYNREYRSVNAVAKGQKFTVISHGVGGAGALICFEELIKLGAKVILRAGTCGSMKPVQLERGAIFVPYAVARDPDMTDMYVPSRMPAVATPRIYQALMNTGKDLGVQLFTGIGLCSGLFYGYGEEHEQHLKRWAKFTDIIDCEFQSLFLAGIARGVETAGLATVDGCPLQWSEVSFSTFRDNAENRRCRKGQIAKRGGQSGRPGAALTAQRLAECSVTMRYLRAY